MAIELTTATTAQLSGIVATFGIPTALLVFPDATGHHWIGGGIHQTNVSNAKTINLKCLANFRHIELQGLNATGLVNIIGGSELVNLEDGGTSAAINFTNCGFSAATLNKLFTDLPATTETATIRVVGCPGAATCNTTIATAKGYTVVTE